MHRIAWVVTLAGGLLGIAGTVWAVESATFIRSGQFREITDATGAGYTILNLRMSTDGTKAVFETTGPFFPEVDAVRLIDTGGGDERVFFQRVDNERRGIDGIAISDDGRRVVYTVALAGNDRELRLYHTDTGEDELLLAELQQLSSNMTRTVNLAHFAQSRLMAMSGDGQYVYFINKFGPIGNFNDSLEPSGQTLYRVHTGSKAVEALFSQSDLAGVPNISPSAVELVSSGGSVATNFDGSVVMLPAGGTGPPRTHPTICYG